MAAGQRRDQPLRELAADRRGQQRQHDPVRVDAAGGGADQADADDPVAEQLGVLLGQRDDRHAAHRVADEHDRPVGHGLVDDAQQVAAELLDGGVLLVGAARATV